MRAQAGPTAYMFPTLRTHLAALSVSQVDVPLYLSVPFLPPQQDSLAQRITTQ